MNKPEVGGSPLSFFEGIVLQVTVKKNHLDSNGEFVTLTLNDNKDIEKPSALEENFWDDF